MIPKECKIHRGYSEYFRVLVRIRHICFPHANACVYEFVANGIPGIMCPREIISFSESTGHCVPEVDQVDSGIFRARIQAIKRKPESST